ncbi:MAG: DNA polymerase I [Elusimicrobia bacterium]|nr:DNA polymerase I [Elusimicrobiota bacterium]
MKPRLYLVDAHAYLHRAYHAMPPLTNAKGEPVGALFGFAKMLLQLVKREKPDRVAVCFDTPGPTFRHKAYAAYKATRKEIDPDLIAQLKQAKGVAEAMGFVCAELPGYEADDIMATLARRSVKDGLQAVLVTGDKDALQLVSPGIRVLKDVGTSAWMDAPQIEEKFGVGPDRVLDFLSITGDTSDNVPGVRGVGPVGAAKLIKRFGDAKKILKAAKANDPDIPPKTAKAIVESEKELLAALDLIKLEENAPVHIKPDDCRLPEPDPDKVKEVLGNLGFVSLIKELVAGVAVEASSSAPAEGEAGRREHGGGGQAAQSVVAVMEREETKVAVKEVPFSKLCKTLQKADAVTVTAARGEEGPLLDAPSALALGSEDGDAAVLEAHEAKKEHSELSKILSGKSLKVGYDLKETEGALTRLGLELGPRRFDTMVAAYCLSPVRARPEPAAKGDWRGPLLSRAARALGHEELRKRMKEAGVLKLFDEVEMPLVEVLREMEDAGIAVDETYLKRLSSEFEKDIAALKAELDKLAGAPINVNSPKQLGELLFDKLGLQVVHKTAKGGRSTDEEALQVLASQHPIPAKVLDYRELTKLKSTYIEGLLERIDAKTHRVHTHFEQTGAETGRLSSLNPNLQNIPVRTGAGQKIRRAFIAGKGEVLVSADYSQIDLRVLAHVSQDAGLKDAFSHDADIHTRTACEVFHVEPSEVDKELRRRAKAVNFGIVYGQTAFGLANQLGIPQKEAADIIKKYFARYQGVARWIEQNLEAARRDGFARTFLGRIRYIPELSAKNTALRQFGERAARNTPIQGGSADVIKLAMLRVREGLSKGKWKARMLLQIHDELLFEAPSSEAKDFAHWVKKVMEGAASLSVPLVVDVKSGPNWQDMEKIA